MSTCTGLSALDHANTKHSRGYATTGVGIGVCARHEFIQLNGAVDLQKGERYANMDYAFASFLRHHDSALTKVVSYDIACQWHKNVVRRVKSLPSLIACDLGLQNLKFAIPKLHIHGHQLACQLKFSLNWLRGAGRTDGEGVERPWAHLGPIASSTRDMGPGSRHGTMNDHFGHWNWVKLIGLVALKEFQTQQESLGEFTQGRGVETVEWRKRIERWEEDQEKPEAERTTSNPYELPKSGLTEHDVRLKLTEEEARQAQNGSFALHEIGPAAFISQLLELEDQQRSLSLDVDANAFKTASQKTILMERRTKVMRLMGQMRSIQALYMPGALQFLGQRTVEPEEHIENIPCVFPSDLSVEQRTTGCHVGLPQIEEQLREAQLRGALDSLRNHLHMKSRLLTYRKSNVKAQAMITKSQALLKRNQKQIDSDVHRYRTAWSALECLRGIGQSGWTKLKSSDVRMMDGGEDRALGMARKRIGKKKQDAASTLSSGVLDLSDRNSPEDEDLNDATELQRARRGVGEGFRDTSWIWKEGGNGNLIDDQALEEFIRVEWSKSYSRVQRWKEELALIEEERRRVLVSLEYESSQWDKRQIYSGPLAAKTDDVHGEGVRAYALSQAHLYRRIAQSFRRLWDSSEGADDNHEVVGEMDSASEDEEEDEAGILGDDDLADIPEDYQ
ncbi:hypothetical protein C8R42DRAFT_720583 [Lentinula raphanica]|nr:hypothetical protein C8R42DRAFT_720583 [Lentinula raphanica]